VATTNSSSGFLRSTWTVTATASVITAAAATGKYQRRRPAGTTRGAE
jgi:hypothetical protein